ncbi:hypothetical protein MRX96_055434 [Rhipicephalus microplus]
MNASRQVASALLATPCLLCTPLDPLLISTTGFVLFPSFFLPSPSILQPPAQSAAPRARVSIVREYRPGQRGRADAFSDDPTTADQRCGQLAFGARCVVPVQGEVCPQKPRFMVGGGRSNAAIKREISRSCRMRERER